MVRVFRAYMMCISRRWSCRSANGLARGGWVVVSRCRVGCVHTAGTNVNRCGECRTAVSKAAIRRSGVGGGKKEDRLNQESSRWFKQGRCLISILINLV